MANFILYLISAIVLVISTRFTIKYLLDNKHLERFYIFDLKELHATCLASIEQNGENTKALVNGVLERLRADKKLAPYLNYDDKWVLNNAAGAMGAVYFVHASATEYVIIFGTATGTEGHTGRLTADDYFHILQGTQLAFAAGTFEAEVYTPGMVHYLPRGYAKQMKMPELCFAVGYARGWIPGLLPLAYADGLFSTCDYRTLWDTVRITSRLVFSNLWKGKI